MPLQSVIISKEDYTLDEAMYIIQEILKLNPLKLHITERTYRFRIREPNKSKRYWVEEDNNMGGVKYVMYI